MTSECTAAVICLYYLILNLWNIATLWPSVNDGHPEAATSVADVYSMLYMLSNINVKMFVHISVIAQIYSIIKNVWKLWQAKYYNYMKCSVQTSCGRIEVLLPDVWILDFI
jgi:hypothetical protein